MADYANESTENFVSEKYFMETTLLKFPRPDNLDPVQEMDDFLVESLKQKKKSKDISVDNTFEKIEDKVTNIMVLFSKL